MAGFAKTFPAGWLAGLDTLADGLVGFWWALGEVTLR